MADLIDRQAAIDTVSDCGICIQKILDLPPADVQPVRHGHWILCENQRQDDVDNGNYLYICSNCNHSDIHAKTVEVPFCWHCGARMDGE